MDKEKIAAIYVVKPEFHAALCAELENVAYSVEDLVFSSRLKKNACFAQDIWLEPQIVNFASISEAVKILRQASKFWYLHPLANIRRSRLIEEQLRRYQAFERHFPVEEDIPDLGVFCLLDKNTLVFSSKRLKKMA